MQIAGFFYIFIVLSSTYLLYSTAIIFKLKESFLVDCFYFFKFEIIGYAKLGPH